MATMECFLLMCHEWIYTDQFLKTVLWLDFKKLPAPLQSEEDFYKERKRRIDTTAGILSAIYYFMVTAWTITSIIIDNFAFRMGQCFLVAIQTSVFLYCLLRIRKVMHEVARYQDEN